MPDCFCVSRCKRQVLICSRCDRGQQYCGAGCSGLARRESMTGVCIGNLNSIQPPSDAYTRVDTRIL